jgi:GNAT superfamily N-acetyltransferase
MSTYALEPMTISDTDQAVELIRGAMNDDEAQWARETIVYHFRLSEAGLTDGRSYFVRRDAGRLIGITGLHCYNWGPPENVWLAWFAVHPEYHGSGLGKQLMDGTIELARTKGFQKLFIETYSQDVFHNARLFYEAQGFEMVGRIENYLSDFSAMVVYMKRLA